jgi:hypothetical protein
MYRPTQNMMHPETLLREQKMSQDKNSVSYDMLHYNMAGLHYVDHLNISLFDKSSKGFQRIQNESGCILGWNLDHPSWVCLNIPRFLQEKMNNMLLC